MLGWWVEGWMEVDERGCMSWKTLNFHGEMKNSPYKKSKILFDH